MSCGIADRRTQKVLNQGWCIVPALLPQVVGPLIWQLRAPPTLQDAARPSMTYPQKHQNSTSVTFCQSTKSLRAVHIEQKEMKLHLSMTELAKNFWPSLTYFRLSSDHKIFIFFPQDSQGHQSLMNYGIILKSRIFLFESVSGASEDSWVWFFRSASWPPLYQKSCELKVQVRSPSYSTHSGGIEIG